MHYVFTSDTEQTIDCRLGSRVLRSMFLARKSVFVDLLKWDVPVLEGRFEVDQFDDGHAVYHVLADAGERHLASARLLPTTRPHILDSLYPNLCSQLPPRGPDIFEITRFCLDRSLRAAGRRQVRDTLVCHLVEHALANRITAYTAIAEASWFRQIVQFGWTCDVLGSSLRIDGKELWAIRIGITAETPALLAARGIVPTSHYLARAA